MERVTWKELVDQSDRKYSGAGGIRNYSPKSYLPIINQPDTIAPNGYEDKSFFSAVECLMRLKGVKHQGDSKHGWANNSN
jgi:hypothetical protein